MFLEREGGSREDDTLVPGGFLSSCERVASAGWKEGIGWKRAQPGTVGDGRMDSFIFLVDLAYISPPPEADTKTNGLSSRSYKTSPPNHPRPSPLPLATAFCRRRRPARLAIECKCKTLKRRANLLNVLSDVKSRALVSGTTTKSGGHRGRVSRLMATRNINPLWLKIPPRVSSRNQNIYSQVLTCHLIDCIVIRR